jgi:hypothetical protein
MLIIRRNRSTGGVEYEVERGAGLHPLRQPPTLSERRQPAPPVADGRSKWLRDNERLVRVFDGAVEDVIDDIVEEGTFSVRDRDRLRQRLREHLRLQSSSARRGASSPPAPAALHDDDAAA